MPSIEELKREKERLELERDIRRLREQNDRREAVENAKTAVSELEARVNPKTVEKVLLFLVVCSAAVLVADALLRR